MRIAVTTCNRTILGGVETYLQALLPKLQANGHDVALIYESNLKDGRRDIIGTSSDIPHWDQAELGTASVLSEIVDWRPSVIYNHGMNSLELDKALASSFPTVRYVHDYYGTCISGNKSFGLTNQVCHRRFGPMCLLCYLPLRCGGLSPSTMWRLYYKQRARLHEVLPKCDRVLVASQHMQDEYIRHGLPTDRLVRIPYGTNCQVDPHPSTRPGRGQILFIGRITKQKGLNLLLSAIPIAQKSLKRQLSVAVAGDGPDAPAIKRLARKLGVQAEFHGWLEAPELDRLMRTADLLAVPSIWPEPFGLVGVEAACRSLPAVGFNVGGIPDWLIDGETGALAGATPTATGFAAAMVRAMSSFDQLNVLAENAWKNAKNFTMETHLRRLVPLLEASHSRARSFAVQPS